MTSDEDLAELIGLEPDERLLDEELSRLPSSVGRPETLPVSTARRRLVAVGATLTGVTLVLGVVLIAAGIAGAIAGSAGLGVAGIVLGVLLVATHWGWVHVAEISGRAIENRRDAAVQGRQHQWLGQIDPYTRYEVITRAADDGSITIETVRYRPSKRSERSFTFVRDAFGSESHSGDEPAAAVAERAEVLRRQAAVMTEQERERYEVANDAYQTALMAHADEAERVAAVRAASQALSERINAHLRDPPLTE